MYFQRAIEMNRDKFDFWGPKKNRLVYSFHYFVDVDLVRFLVIAFFGPLTALGSPLTETILKNMIFQMLTEIKKCKLIKILVIK